MTAPLKTISFIAALQPGLILLFGCEEEASIPPAPSAQTTLPTEVDHQHSATIRGDRQLVIPNLRFVVQHDPGGSDLTGLTLLSTRPGLDGSRLIFGATQSLLSMSTLTGADIHLGGGRILDPQGNGVFTPATVYQPKFAVLKITALSDTDASGKITGEFYRFRTASPLLAPAVVKLDIDFTAALIVR